MGIQIIYYEKFYSLLIAVSFVFNINAQTVSGFNNIVDVNEILFSSTYLNDGKYVILNFYLETCGNCIASAPKFNQFMMIMGRIYVRL